MAKPVLGNDPFAKPEENEPEPRRAKPVVILGGGEQEARTAAPGPAPRHKRPARSQPKPRPTPPEPPASRVAEERFEEFEERLSALEARVDSGFSTLEDKLDRALARLEAAPVVTSIAEPADRAEEEEAEEDADEAFIGFLGDTPEDVRADEDEGDQGARPRRSRRHRRTRGDGRPAPTFLGGLLDLFTPAGLGRRLGDVGMRGRSDEVDEFGMDPVYYERAIQFFDWMYQKYWRVETEGLEHIPDEGRGLVVGNHSGTLPFDGVMIGTAVRLHHPAEREVRALAEDMFSTLPFLAPLLSRVGAVRACPENAERLLRKDELVVVFPEGVKGTGKYFRQRYKLQRFGRGGFVKLCLRTGAPLIPVAVVGSEEIYPIIAKADWLGKPLGLPYTPITPTFPLLGPLGLIPLPTKWKIRFGEPMTFTEYGPEAIDDDILINHLKEEVRGRIQEMINDMLRNRRSVWFG